MPKDSVLGHSCRLSGMDLVDASGGLETRANEHGYVAPMTTLLLIPMMIFAALVVDVGGWFVRADKAQTTADSAALAAVAWMPDLAKATQVALDIAARNGIVDQPGCDGAPSACTPTTLPQVVVSGVSNQRVRVDIYTEGDFYFGSVLEAAPVTIQRNAVAEYVLPVPMGNPSSALGLGTELAAGGVTSNFWLRAMTECESRQTGDFIGAGGGCPTNTNPNHRDEGHTFIIDIPVDGAYEIQARTTCAEFGGQQANASMRFRFFDADDTPLDDHDNVLAPPLSEVVVPRPSTAICPTDGSGWSRTNEPAPWVTIGNASAAGRYVLQAKNPDYYSSIRSLYSLRIIPTGFVGSYSCSRIGATGSASCPSIFAKDYLTAYTHAQMFPSGTIGLAQLYLAEIDDIHAGKTMQVELFDPADGIDSVRIVDPNGDYVDFSWHTIDCLVYSYDCSRGDLGTVSSPIHQTCSGIPCLKQASGISFQNRTIRIAIPLDQSYACAYTAGEPDDCWWKVEYEDNNSNANETTTWGVTLLGDPIHLVE